VPGLREISEMRVALPRDVVFTLADLSLDARDPVRRGSLGDGASILVGVAG
jgi:hypothetical protein